jgi:hypothetical protein
MSVVFGKRALLLPLVIVVLAFPLAACQAPQESSPRRDTVSSTSSTAAAAPGAGEICPLPEHRNYLLGTWSGRWQYSQSGVGSTLKLTLSRSSHKWADFDVHVRHHLPYGDYGGTMVEYDSVAYIRDCHLVVVSSREEERWWHFDLVIDQSDPTKASLDTETWFGDHKDKPIVVVLDYTSFDSKFIWPTW